VGKCRQMGGMDSRKVPEVPESPRGVGPQEVREGMHELAGAGSGLEVVHMPSDSLQWKLHQVWLACQTSRPWHMGPYTWWCLPFAILMAFWVSPISLGSL
jgi:hypothetical protein